MSGETREFERLYQIELDRVYKELGYENIQRIHGKENEDYDLILTKNGRGKKIEEKGLQYYHKDCPIELIQDIWPFNLGWFYKTHADYIHFFYYQELMPHTLYQLSPSKLKENLGNIFKDKKAMPRLSVINYGITINLCIPWKYLIEINCAFILKKWNKIIEKRDLF